MWQRWLGYHSVGVSLVDDAKLAWLVGTVSRAQFRNFIRHLSCIMTSQPDMIALCEWILLDRWRFSDSWSTVLWGTPRLSLLLLSLCVHEWMHVCVSVCFESSCITRISFKELCWQNLKWMQTFSPTICRLKKWLQSKKLIFGNF